MPSKSQPDEAAGRRRKTQFATKRAQDNVPKEQAEQRLTQLRAQRMSAMQQQRKEVKIVGDDNAAKAMKRRETRAAGALLPNSLSVGPKNYNNNCDANNEDMTIDDGMTEDQREEAKALEQHLIGISPFNGRWDVEKTISAGTFGVAFFVRDNLTNTQGVIKVARSAVGEASNTTAEWEGFILERIFKTNPSANIVRLLDKGMLEDQNGERLEFLGVELCHQTVREYIGEAANPEDRGYRVCRVALGSLKGIFDLHIQGILHRDIKPDNMGIINQVGNPVCVLYDLGMARLYTDCDGFLRPPRTVVPFRGTVEWSSGHAAKGRDQSRFDDLIGWFYVIVELFGPEFTANDLDPRPFPWNYCENHSKACRYLKSVYTPARLLLRHCPIQMYNVNMYLQCASRMKVPDYKWIANNMADAMADFKRKADALKKLEKQKKRSATTQEPDEHE